jgi:CTP synthase
MRLGGQDVELVPGTMAAELFKGARMIRQRFRHRYEVDPAYVETLEKAGLIFSGKHPVHPIMQVLELPRSVHPYFLAGQFHPELTSRPLRPQPMFVGLVAAAMKRQSGDCPTQETDGQPAKV